MNTPKHSYQDLIAGLMAMAAGIFFFITTIGTKSFTTGTIKADTIPKVVACALFLLGGGIIARWRWHERGTASAPETVAPEKTTEEVPQEKDRRKDLYQKITTPITLLLIFLYILLMDKIGFVFSTILYLTAQITLLSTEMSRKIVLKSLLIAIVSAILIFLVFGKAFQLPLPVNDYGF